MNRRVVFDTSTLVGAALRIGSIPHQELLEAFAAYDLCASFDTLKELEQVFESKKFDRYPDRRSRSEFIALLRRHVHLFAMSATDLEAVKPPCRDPRDHIFLALASAADAGTLVSSDEDLLVLHPWHELVILRLRSFSREGRLIRNNEHARSILTA